MSLLSLAIRSFFPLLSFARFAVISPIMCMRADCPKCSKYDSVCGVFALLTPSLQKKFPGGDVGNIFLLSWIRFREVNDALVGLRWKSMARCILQNLLACLRIARSHKHLFYRDQDYKSY
jgi:hypothetical protein